MGLFIGSLAAAESPVGRVWCVGCSTIAALILIPLVQRRMSIVPLFFAEEFGTKSTAPCSMYSLERAADSGVFQDIGL